MEWIKKYLPIRRMMRETKLTETVSKSVKCNRLVIVADVSALSAGFLVIYIHISNGSR